MPRLAPDPEVVALRKAITARIEALGPYEIDVKDGVHVYRRGDAPFLQIETKRDHMLLDLWLTTDVISEARASGIARSHPFFGEGALKIRFERAADLARVARWIENSYQTAPSRPPIGSTPSSPARESSRARPSDAGPKPDKD